ncbi:MAG: hypothetical protein CL807_08840 [Citromicrobium sp.]|nr:hypothetical protein [Citromicrobium sp.]|tara:strand:+ start:198 stop:956 length:759 start_codon:yes stop_codon:yes gene_type:complete
MKAAKNLWAKLSQPASLVAVVGTLGFFADYLWRPISNAGLILLGFVVAPFLIKLVKRISLSGIDLELLEQASEPEQQRKLEREALDSIATDPKGFLADKDGLANEPVQQAPTESIQDRYLSDEGLIIRELSSRNNGRVRREVKVGDRIFDALITSRYSNEIIEIKIYYQKFLTVENLTNTVRQLSEARQYLQRRSPEVPIKARLVIGVDSSNENLLTSAQVRTDLVRNSWPEIEIELFDLSKLKMKWGLASQ